jgi:GNAT superfamily N-acetyltransferase
MRDVEADGSATTRVKLAAELERLGRTDDAVDVLAAVRRDPVARLALERLRPPLGLDGDHRADVRPLRSRPSLLWETAIPHDCRVDSPLFGLGPRLVVTVPAIIVQGNRRDFGVDPDTGARLWDLPSTRLLGVGRRLFSVGRHASLQELDPLTGRLSRAIRLAGERIDMSLGPIVVTGDTIRGCRVFRGFRLDGSSPVLDFAVAVPPAVQTGAFLLVGATRNSVVFRSFSGGREYGDDRFGRTVVLDRQTGEIRWVDEGWIGPFLWACNDEGLLFTEPEGIAARGDDGTVLWRWSPREEHSDFGILAIGPSVLVATGWRSGGGRTTFVIDRFTGKGLGTIPIESAAAWLCRDVVYLHSPGGSEEPPLLGAFTVNGDPIWSLETRVAAIALDPRGALVCVRETLKAVGVDRSRASSSSGPLRERPDPCCTSRSRRGPSPAGPQLPWLRPRTYP